MIKKFNARSLRAFELATTQVAEKKPIFLINAMFKIASILF
jgi:hypothetical protein